MTKVEEVARALARNFNSNHFDRGDSDSGWEEQMDAARGAIEAMRDINPRVSAVVSVNWTLSPEQVERLFQQVVDAALDEQDDR